MKRFLLFAIVLWAILPSVFSQTQLLPQSPYPCLRFFSVKNLGNPPGCSSTFGGYKKTGLVTLSFATSIPVGVNLPEIIAFYQNDSITAVDIKFVLREAIDRQSYTFCFYTPDGNNVLDNGSKSRYVAKIQYAGYAPATCEVLNGSVPLPVSFKLFTVSRSNSSNLLKWTTASEVNNKGFYAERFYNGKWETLGFIASKGVYGNSDQDLNYTFTDIFNFTGMVQYRILQVDIDGKSQYSKIQSLSNAKPANSALVYPNPASANSIVSIILADAGSVYDIQVIDNAGRVIKEFKAVKNAQQLSGLLRGQYMIRIKENGKANVSSEKIIVQ